MRYDPERIQSRLEEETAGLVLVYKETTDSTNNDAKKAAEEGAAGGFVFLTENQTAGKGRRGNTWNSRAEDCLTFTVLVRPKLSPEKFSLLAPVMGLAVSESCEALSGLKSLIKWPNDVLIDSRKVCGILVEAGSRMDYAVIGCGINTGFGLPPEELADKAVYLSEAAGREISREDMLAEVLKRFAACERILEKEDSFASLKPLYESRLVNIGRQVSVISPKGSVTALCLGIDEDGALLIKKENGETEKVFAGEVSVRGIYGYV